MAFPAIRQCLTLLIRPIYADMNCQSLITNHILLSVHQ